MNYRDEIQVVILAGGLGTRLRPYTYIVPKPMLPVGTKPIIEHIIEWLKSYNLKKIIISASYLSKIIQDYLSNGSSFGVKIEHVVTNKPLGTAGQLKAVENKINSELFLCVYGDAILNFNLERLIKFHLSKEATATITLMKYSTELKYGFIETDNEGRLKSWKEKPVVSGYINVGCYAMAKKFLSYIPANKVFGMDLAFKKAIENKERIYGFKTKGEFIDVGNRKAYIKANRIFLERMGRLP